MILFLGSYAEKMFTAMAFLQNTAPRNALWGKGLLGQGHQVTPTVILTGVTVHASTVDVSRNLTLAYPNSMDCTRFCLHTY